MGYVKSVKQLVQHSKCPIVITATHIPVDISLSSHLQTDIASITPHRIILPSFNPQSTLLHVAAILIANKFTPSAQDLLSVVMQNRYDFRKSINTLQFISNQPFGSVESDIEQYGYQRYTSLLYWPLIPYHSKWKPTVEYIPTLNDRNTDYFLNSNFLHFLCSLHPERYRHCVECPRLVIKTITPCLVPLSGGRVTVRGERLIRVNEVLLAGCDEGARPLVITEQSDTVLEVLVPSLPRGLYHLHFYLKNGEMGRNDIGSPWFGNNGLLVTELP